MLSFSDETEEQELWVAMKCKSGTKSAGISPTRAMMASTIKYVSCNTQRKMLNSHY